MTPSDKESISEAMPAGLMRVIRKLKRKGSDGKVKEYEQAFHVKKAAPGDRYAQRKEMEVPDQPGSAASVPGVDQGSVSQVQADPGQVNHPEVARVAVKVLELPWELGDRRDSTDPVPPEIRKRFDPLHKNIRTTNPLSHFSPANTVTPAEQMMWGVVEQELVQRLRSGRMTKFKVAGSSTGAVFVKVEGDDGYIHNAYLRCEGLNDPYAYQVWGKLYGVVQREGGFSRRAAAAYEISKSTGFDDIVPPTVLRFDEYGNLDPIMSVELIERADRFEESLARATGEISPIVRRRISGFASVQFYPGGFHGIDGEEWFHGLFGGESGGQSETLNRFFDSVPEDRRMAILRTAVFDFILWTGDRTFGNIGWNASIDRKHTSVLLDNEICLPDPRAMALIRPKYGPDYLSQPRDPDAFPLMWSDPAMLVAARGGDLELRDYEEIAVDSVRRMRDGRSVELVRSLMDHQISHMAIAGMLARVGMLWTHHQQIARNPYLAMDYFFQLGTESSEPGILEAELHEVETYVNDVMSEALGRPFNFSEQMLGREAEETDAGDQ